MILSRITTSTRIAAAALACGAALPAAAQAPRVETWPAGEGTTIALVEDHRVPLVTMQVDLPGGTWSPWVRDNHAEEAWEIQLHDPASALRARADRLGADLSVDMGESSAWLRVSCRKEDVPAVLALVRDVLAQRDFDRHELRRRRAGRRIDWSASLKDPQFVLARAVSRLLFVDGDPRRRAFEEPGPTSTDPARLAAVRDALLRFPGRIVGWAGDVTRAQAEEWSRELLPPAAVSAPATLEPRLPDLTPQAARGAARAVTMPRLTQVYFSYAAHTPSLTDADYPALLVADHVLGGHFHSRLYTALRHEGGDTYGAMTRRTTSVQPGGYVLFTFTRTANAADTETRLRDVLGTLHRDGITEDERAAAAGYLVGRRAFERQSPGQVLDRYLWEFRRGLPVGFLDSLPERAAAVPIAEVNAFIRRFYAPGRFTMVTVRPPRG